MEIRPPPARTKIGALACYDYIFLYIIVSLLLILSLNNSVFTAKSEINDVCLFVCLVFLMFLGFRPHSYNSVASCLGSKIKNQRWRSAFISLKTKRHNLNARSIIQRKQHYSGMISKNLSTSRSILCSFFEHNRQKLNLCRPLD